MYLCIYVFMQGHGSYPGLGLTQTWNTQQLLTRVIPKNSDLASWLAVQYRLPMEGTDKLEVEVKEVEVEVVRRNR